jgi:hypothetical protein
VQEGLVSRAEKLIADGGLLALGICILLRLAVWYALTRNNPMLDSQLIWLGLLVTLYNLAGLYLPRTYSVVPQTLGALCWLAGMTLLPRYFQSIWRTGSRPDWLVFTALGLVVASFIARLITQRIWSGQIYGKGWAWIDNWARDRSLRARMLASRALVTLGYRRARQAASVDTE